MGFRPAHRELTQEEQSLVFKIEQAAAVFSEFISDIPPGRERSLAQTKLEECVMWAVKGVTG